MTEELIRYIGRYGFRVLTQHARGLSYRERMLQIFIQDSQGIELSFVVDDPAEFMADLIKFCKDKKIGEIT